MNKKERKRFKIVISRKSNGEIHEFVLTSDLTYEMALDFARNHFPFSDCDVLAVCPVDPPVPRLAKLYPKGRKLDDEAEAGAGNERPDPVE